MEHGKDSDIIAITNGSHVTLKKIYLYVSLFLAMLLIIGSYIIPPFIWKTNIENEILVLHKADTSTVNMVQTIIGNQNTLLDNQSILQDNFRAMMDNQIEIRANVVDLRKLLHSGWITPIPDNYQRMKTLKQNRLK